MAKQKTAPEAETTTESCGSCRYHVGWQCRRHAPAPMSRRMLEHALGQGAADAGFTLAWPNVKDEDWCGEYRQAGGTR